MTHVGSQEEDAITRVPFTQSPWGLEPLPDFIRKSHRRKMGSDVTAFSEEAEVFMPNEKDILKSGVMNRKSIDTKGIAWTLRLVVVTESTIYFAKADDPRCEVLDYIDLTDIVSASGIVCSFSLRARPPS